MNPNEDRTTRWLAYWLGDLEPDEAARVDAEMRDDPAKAEEVRRFFEATTDWAKRPVAEAPVDMAELAARTRDAAQVPAGHTRFRTAWPWAAVAAAAALLIVGLSQASFSVQLAGTTLAWGNPQQSEAVTQLESELSALNASYTELAEDNLRLYDGFEELIIALQQLETQLQVTASELARNQEREAHTRYTDMQRMLEMMRRTSVVLPYGDGPTAMPASYTGKP